MGCSVRKSLEGNKLLRSQHLHSQAGSLVAVLQQVQSIFGYLLSR